MQESNKNSIAFNLVCFVLFWFCFENMPSLAYITQVARKVSADDRVMFNCRERRGKMHPLSKNQHFSNIRPFLKNISSQKASIKYFISSNFINNNLIQKRATSYKKWILEMRFQMLMTISQDIFMFWRSYAVEIRVGHAPNTLWSKVYRNLFNIYSSLWSPVLAWS